jgi:ATP-dependent exoDNAse (exonuclease V) alpha subunit
LKSGHGDIRNDHDLNVFNGDVGRARAIDPVERERRGSSSTAGR